MNAEANRALAQRWMEEVWNQGKDSTIEELFHPEGRAHGFPDPDAVLVGPAGFKVIHSQFLGAFSDIHMHVDEMIADDDRVALRWTCTMTHTGDALGFKATGRKTKVAGSSFMHISDGKLMDGWNYMDLTKMALDLQGVEGHG
jgi:steroid delta-isomerase-like uncharacterized protein